MYKLLKAFKIFEVNKKTKQKKSKKINKRVELSGDHKNNSYYSLLR